MSESNTIIINTHPIKKITLSLNGKEYEIPAYMSINVYFETKVVYLKVNSVN